MNASTVSSGSQLLNRLKLSSPANTSNHEILRLPAYALSTDASRTRTAEAQMSGPVPSPLMNGMIGLSGTSSLPAEMEIFPPAGGVTSL